MKQAGSTQKGKKPADQGPMKPQDVIELPDQRLQRVQGGLTLTTNLSVDHPIWSLEELK